MGVLIACIAGQMNTSPFEAGPANWARLEFNEDAATSNRIRDASSTFGQWLDGVARSGDGLIYRHGWLVQILIGLLASSASRRLTVHQAFNIARLATARGMGVSASAAFDAASLVDIVRVTNSSKGSQRSEAALLSKSEQKNLKLDDRPDSLPAGAGDTAEPFRSLEAMVNIAERGQEYVVMEKRQWVGIRNYGEVIGFRNRADGDRWDVFAPGLSGDLPIGESLRMRGIIGIVLIKGGNHKLAIALEAPYEPVSREKINADVRAFIRVYKRAHPGISGSRIRYLELENLDDFSGKQ